MAPGRARVSGGVLMARAISIKAYEMLEWKREAARQTARALTED
jgi:hypothetical protein